MQFDTLNNNSHTICTETWCLYLYAKDLEKYTKPYTIFVKDITYPYIVAVYDKYIQNNS